MSAALQTRFRDMPPGVRNRWVDWCFSHDWCVSAGQNGCREFFVEDRDGEEHRFETPKQLRDWAGY